MLCKVEQLTHRIQEDVTLQTIKKLHGVLGEGVYWHSLLTKYRQYTKGIRKLSKAPCSLYMSGVV